jgi:hypothetical protein
MALALNIGWEIMTMKKRLATKYIQSVFGTLPVATKKLRG